MFLKPSAHKRSAAGSANSEPSTPAAQRRFSVQSTRSFQVEATPKNSTETSQRKVKPAGFASRSSVADLEREIRRLLNERSSILKTADSKDAELNKTVSKLQGSLQAKTHLQSSLARIEKEVKDLRKSNEILKTKLNTLEATGLKKKDIQVELANARGTLVAKEHDLADAKAQVQQLQQRLGKRTNAFKEQEEELRKLKARLSSDIRSLRSDLRSSQAQVGELCSSVSESNYDEDRIENLELTTSSLLGLIRELKDITDSHQISLKLEELKSQISVVLNEYYKMQSTIIASEDTIARLHSECEDKDMIIGFMKQKLHNSNFSRNGSLADTEYSAVSQDVFDDIPKQLTQQWVDTHEDVESADHNSEQECCSPKLIFSNLETHDGQHTEDLEKLRCAQKKQSEIVNQLQLKVQTLETECDQFYQAGASNYEELQNTKSDCGKKALMIASLLQKVERYQGECDATTEAAKNLEEYIRNLQKDNEGLQAELHNVQVDKEGLMAFATELQHQVEDGRTLVAEQELSIDKLQQKVAEMLNSNTDKHAYIEDLEEQVKHLAKTEESLQKELGESADAMLNTKDEIHRLEVECCTKSSLLSALEEEIKDGREKLQHVNENASQLSERICVLEIENGTNSADLLAATEELESVKQSCAETKQHNEMLQHNISKLENELKQSVALVRKLEEDVSVLVDEVKTKSQVLQSTELDLTSSKANFETQVELANELHKSLQKLKDIVEVKNETIVNLESQLASLQDMHNEQCTTIEDKTRELDQVTYEFNDQKVVMQEMHAVNDKLVDEAQTRASTIVELQANLAVLQRDYDEKVCLVDKSKMHADCVQAQLNTNEELIRELQRKISDVNGEHKAALEYQDCLQRSLIESQEQVAAKNALIDELMIKLNTATEATKFKSDAMSALNLEFNQLKVEHEQRITLVQDFENRLDKLTSDYESAKCVYKNVRQHLADVQNDLNGQLKAQTIELQQKMAEMQELRSNCKSLCGERDHLSNSLQRTEETLQNNQVQHASEIKCLNDTINNLKKEISSKEFSINELEQQSGDVQKDLKQQLANRTAELEQTTAEVQELRLNMDILQVKRDSFENALFEKEKLLQEDHVQHLAIVEGLNVTINKLNEENLAKIAAMADMKRELTNDLADANQQLTNIKSQMEHKIQELHSSCNVLQDERDNLAQKISEQTQTIHEMFTAHDAAVQDLTLTIERLKQDGILKDCSIQDLQKILSDTQKEMTEQLTSRTVELQQKVVEIEHLHVKYEELQAEKDCLGNRLVDKEKRMEDIEMTHAVTLKMVKDLEEETRMKDFSISDMQHRAVEMAKVLSSKEECLAKLKEHSTCVQKQLEEKDEILSGTYSKLRELEDEMLEKHSIMEQTASANIKLEEALSQKSNEVNHLHSSVAALTSELEIAHHRQEELCTHIDSLKQSLDEKDCYLVHRESELDLLREQLEQKASQVAEHVAVKDRLFAEKSEVEAVLNKKICDLQLNLKEVKDKLKVSEDKNVKYCALLRDYEAMKQKFMEQEDAGQQEQAAIKAELAKLVECSEDMFNQNKKLNQDKKELREYMRHIEADLHRYKAQTQWYENRERDFTHEMNILEQRVNGSHAELLKWKDLYEELRSKVEPFQEQLDMYQAEKAALLSQNSEAQGEVHKLSQQYAMLLGHQNTKQKIHHVIKLKEESLEVRKENSKLREQVAKLQQKMRRLEDQLAASGQRKRFDPSQAFMHGKENTPVKDVSNSFR